MIGYKFNFSINSKSIILITTFFVILLSVVGIARLEVENSFINYFNKKTEIYKGMKLIDDKLGGTTPLDIIIKFPIKKEKIIDTIRQLAKENPDKGITWLRKRASTLLGSKQNKGYSYRQIQRDTKGMRIRKD